MRTDSTNLHTQLQHERNNLAKMCQLNELFNEMTIESVFDISDDESYQIAEKMISDALHSQIVTVGMLERELIQSMNK